MLMPWLGTRAESRSVWFAGRRFRRTGSSRFCGVYQKQHFLVCAVLVSYAPFVCEHGRLRRAYHGCAVDKNGVEIALQEAPDAPFGAGENLSFDFAVARPEHNRAGFDLEILRSFGCCQPIVRRGIGAWLD